MSLYKKGCIRMDKFKSLLMSFHKKSIQMPNLKFTIFILIITLILGFIAGIFQVLLYGFDEAEDSKIEFREYDLKFIFLYLVLFIPYLETVIFHSLPLALYFFIKKKLHLEYQWDFIIGGILGLIFGVLHGIQYNMWLKGVTFTIIGCLYSYTFFRYRKKGEKGTKGIWYIHALNNFIAFLSLAIGRLF